MPDLAIVGTKIDPATLIKQE